MSKFSRNVAQAYLNAGVSLDEFLREMTVAYLRQALRRNDGNVQLTAKQLGVHRNTITRQLAGHGIDNREFHGKAPQNRSVAPDHDRQAADQVA